MTVNEFKRRWLLSKIRPELFYADLKRAEGKRGTLQIYLTTYAYYDIDKNDYYAAVPPNKYCINASGAIVVKDAKNNVVYNSRVQNGDGEYSNRVSFSIQNLPYGEYKVKVIRSKDCDPDSEWHNVVLSNEYQRHYIMLKWQEESVYIVKTYFDPDLEPPILIPHAHVFDRTGSEYDAVLKNVEYCKGGTRVDYYVGLRAHDKIRSTVFEGSAASLYHAPFFHDSLLSMRVGNPYNSESVKLSGLYVDIFGNVAGEVEYEFSTPIPYAVDKNSETVRYPVGYSTHSSLESAYLEFENLYTGIKPFETGSNAARPVRVKWSSKDGGGDVSGYLPASFSSYSNTIITAKTFTDLVSNADKYASGDFIDDYDTGYIIFDTDYSGRTERTHWATPVYSAYINNVNQSQADGTLIDHGIIKSSSFIIELLDTPIGNAAKNGEKIWWDSKIGIYDNGVFYGNPNSYYSSHAVAIRNRPGDPLDGMHGMTSYNRITVTKYSDDYHEYDP